MSIAWIPFSWVTSTTDEGPFPEASMFPQLDIGASMLAYVQACVNWSAKKGRFVS